MAALLGIAVLVSVLACVGGLMCLYSDRTRRAGQLVAFLSFVAMIAFALLFGQQADRDAIAAGFNSAADKTLAQAAGETDPYKWAITRQQREAARLKEQADRAEADKRYAAEAAIRKAQEEAACRRELRCWAEKSSISAATRCRTPVENMAKYDFKWIDGMLEPKFSHFRWSNRDKGVVTFIGDKIQLQNGLGNWVRHTYECDFDPQTDTAIAARVRPGRIPQ